MTTKPVPREPSRTTRQDVIDRAAVLRLEAKRTTNVLLTGRPGGAGRRNMLFVATATLIVAGLPLAALLPLMLLALTDAVVLDE